MEIQWQGTIVIAAPFADVYRYLAQFERHVEWSQTLEQIELVRSGDDSGTGAQYRTVERQAMQVNRKPGEAIVSGQTITSLLRVRELTPFYRLAWQMQAVPRGATTEYNVNLASDGSGGTRLTMRVHMKPHKTTGFLARFRSATDQAILRGQYAAQWEANLRNFKEVMEAGVRPASANTRTEREFAPDGLKFDARVRGS
jgi:uncharacterized protein YndB with AHSA1/START domain